MFKTPAKEKAQTMNLGPTTFSNSEDSLGKKFQVLNTEDKPLLCTPEKFGGFTVFPPNSFDVFNRTVDGGVCFVTDTALFLYNRYS